MGTDLTALAEQKEPLTTAERERYAELNRCIEDRIQNFVELGLALAEVRDRRLYREEFGTFEEYARKLHELTRMRLHQLIAGAVTVRQIENVNHGLHPTNERQVRPLLKLPEERRGEVWQYAVETAPNGKVTGRHVGAVVKSVLAAPPTPDLTGDAESQALLTEEEATDIDKSRRKAGVPKRAKVEPRLRALVAAAMELGESKVTKKELTTVRANDLMLDRVARGVAIGQLFLKYHNYKVES